MLGIYVCRRIRGLGGNGLRERVDNSRAWTTKDTKGHEGKCRVPHVYAVVFGVNVGWGMPPGKQFSCDGPNLSFSLRGYSRRSTDPG